MEPMRSPYGWPIAFPRHSNSKTDYSFLYIKYTLLTPGLKPLCGIVQSFHTFNQTSHLTWAFLCTLYPALKSSPKYSQHTQCRSNRISLISSYSINLLHNINVLYAEKKYLNCTVFIRIEMNTDHVIFSLIFFFVEEPNYK